MTTSTHLVYLIALPLLSAALLLVLGRIADQALAVGEANIRRGGAVALVVGDDLDTLVLPEADARVGRAEVLRGAGAGARKAGRGKRGAPGRA